MFIIFHLFLRKNVNFIGKDFLNKIKNQKPRKKLVILSLQESKPGYPLLLHDEPIYCEGKIIGETTSGNYSFNYKKNMALGYLNLLDSKEELQKKQFQIEVAKTKYNSTLQLKALHDPKNILMKK